MGQPFGYPCLICIRGNSLFGSRHFRGLFQLCAEMGWGDTSVTQSCRKGCRFTSVVRGTGREDELQGKEARSGINAGSFTRIGRSGPEKTVSTRVHLTVASDTVRRRPHLSDWQRNLKKKSQGLKGPNNAANGSLLIDTNIVPSIFKIWMLSRWCAVIPTRKTIGSALKPVEHTVCSQMPAIDGNTQSREMEPPTSKWPAEH